MIHARADQEKNIKNAVADNISGYGYPESHLLQCDLYRTEKMGLYFFQILAGDRNSGNCRSALIRLYGMPCIVETMIGISVCFLLIAEIKIIKGMHRKPLGKRKEHFEEDTKTGSATRWIIVLGAQVRGRKITDSLKRRLDCASEYLKEHPDVHVIVSGGQGKDEEVTEAYAMARYLECEGLDRRRIVQEDVSVNTLENLKFSRNLIADVDTPVGIVSKISMYIEGVYMQNVQDLRSRFRYRQAAIHYYSQIILCGNVLRSGNCG